MTLLDFCARNLLANFENRLYYRPRISCFHWQSGHFSVLVINILMSESVLLHVHCYYTRGLNSFFII